MLTNSFLKYSWKIGKYYYLSLPDEARERKKELTISPNLIKDDLTVQVLS